MLGPSEYRRVVCSSQFNINLFTKENFDLTNQRMFEVPACGGLLVSERTEITECLFGDRRGYLGFRDAGELDEILAGPRDYSAIREAGRAAVIESRSSFGERFETLYSAIGARTSLL
jgi:spore maturation protein CgeB